MIATFLRAQFCRAWFVLAVLVFSIPVLAQTGGLISSGVVAKSLRSGNWSDPAIWNTGKIPGQGDHVVIDMGHAVTYDAPSSAAIRLIHIRGKLVFSRTQSTQLDVGMIILQMDETVDENANCSTHQSLHDHGEPRPTLEVGSPLNPIPANITARIRLTDFADMKDDCGPGIICYGGRMDFHGAPLNRTWTKLGAAAAAGATAITLAETVNWKVGDHLIVTGTVAFDSFKGSGDTFRGKSKAQTEENFIAAISGNTITLRTPLKHAHLGAGEFRGEAANLSRNVVIASRDPNGVRGHTMYHANSRGSISYAEFAHLGKLNVLARYPIHYHVMRGSNRGSSIIGASIWDSHNRWVTIHGTDYLVVRDCVGYQSVGHGYFMEDASEIYNFLDHNLAVLGYTHKPLPNQALAYDENAGAGFWWANGRNAFLNNTATECDQYGYQFDVRPETRAWSLLQPDGSVLRDAPVDNLAYMLFKNNEAHGMMMYAFWGNGNAAPNDPFIIRSFRGWLIRYGLSANANNTLVEDLNLWESKYGFYGKDPGNVKVVGMKHDGAAQFPVDFYERPQGLATFENLLLNDLSEYPFRITGKKDRALPCDVHVRNYTVTNVRDNTYGVSTEGSNAKPSPELTMYLHDFFGPNRDAKVIPATQTRNDGLTYQTMTPAFSPEVRVAEVNAPFPDNPIKPVDKLPPATVMTFPPAEATVPVDRNGRLVVRGVCIDASRITSVTVNGVAATATAENFSQWEATLTNLPAGEVTLTAKAIDEPGNQEMTPHVMKIFVDKTSAVTAPSNANGAVREYELAQNYPNPFLSGAKSRTAGNPETKVSFTIPFNTSPTQRVQLAIFNVLGRQVRLLVDGDFAPGRYTQTWDGRDDFGRLVPSGIYFYQLKVTGKSEAGGFERTRKMVLAR
jgi:hypothetical protein